jgi:hypothetical protein
MRRHEVRLSELRRRLQRLSPQARLAGLRGRLDGLASRLAAARAANLRGATQRGRGRVHLGGRARARLTEHSEG